MSNYKPRIESNNLDLTSILSTINELPEAGSGGPTLETCTVTFVPERSGIFDSLCYTTLEDGEYTFVSSNVDSGGGSVTVLKDSILFVYAQSYGIISQLQGGVSSLCTTYNPDFNGGGNVIGMYDAMLGTYCGILHITGDCTINYTNPELAGAI